MIARRASIATLVGYGSYTDWYLSCRCIGTAFGEPSRSQTWDRDRYYGQSDPLDGGREVFVLDPINLEGVHPCSCNAGAGGETIVAISLLMNLYK